MTRRLSSLILLLVVACGGRDGTGSDGGTSPTTEAACSIPVGDMALAPGSVSDGGNKLSCTGNVSGHVLACGSGSATLEKKSCSDGFAYVLKSGSETLLLRVKAGSSWTAGAKLDGIGSLTGNITISHLPPPGQTSPEAGSQQAAQFVLNGTTGGAPFAGSGSLSVTW